MQRYFSNQYEKDSYLLNPDDEYHIKKVMRMDIGNQIEIVDKEKVFVCEITSLDPVRAKVVREIDEKNESLVKVILVQSLVNEQKMDYILQKGTELGAYAFYGYKAYNSVIKENGKSAKKIMRWQRIVKEASEQAKRNIIPRVCDIIDIKELIKMEADVKLLLTVNEKSNNLKKVLQGKRKYDTMMIVIGPEGGWTKDEEKILLDSGFIPTSLGPRVLRTETAGVAFLAMINYEWMV